MAVVALIAGSLFSAVFAALAFALTDMTLFTAMSVHVVSSAIAAMLLLSPVILTDEDDDFDSQFY